MKSGVGRHDCNGFLEDAPFYLTARQRFAQLFEAGGFDPPRHFNERHFWPICEICNFMIAIDF